MPVQTADWTPSQTLVWPHAAKFFYDTASGRYVLSQSPVQVVTSVFAGISVRSCAWKWYLWCIRERQWCRHTPRPSFENEFPIALLKSALCQWDWHQHCSSLGVFGLWEEGPIGQRTARFIIKRKARKWLFLWNVIEKEKGKDIVVISSLSHADIAPINHIS